MTEPKTLDEIAKRLGHYPWTEPGNAQRYCEKCSSGKILFDWVLWPCPFRAALAEARDLGRAERDKEWREAADHSFDGIRPNAELIELYTSERDLPTAIIHEIWKRDPRTQEAVAEERKRVFHELTSFLTSAELARAGKAFAALDAREKESR
jgi:hypothetical protein